MLDIVTGQMQPFSPDLVITNQIPWDYNPEAYSELADDTLNKLACGDQPIRALLEECIGYCFYRANDYKKSFMLAEKMADVTKSAVGHYVEYEQLVGGVETLFKDSSGKLIDYAEKAYKTAGMSSNQYMNTATSFAASLIQGLGGDTAKAVELTNLAITDMSDNANKMGTDIGSIQDAYQGFAKQNYTMLDNLKLGYGGTQSEMIRLINDSGVLGEKIESLDNVTFDQMIEAIHKIQDNLGITGTTALANTISNILMVIL